MEISRSGSRAVCITFVLLTFLLLDASALATECVDYSGYFRWISTTSLDDPALDLATGGSHVFLAGGQRGLVVRDCSDPASVVEVAAASTGTDVRQVCVSGDLAFVRAADGMATALDVSDPGAPVVLGSVQTASALSTAMRDGFVYAPYWNGLQVIDVRDPDHPALHADLDIGGSPYSATLAGEELLVVDYDGALLVFDVSVPGEPVLGGTVDLPFFARHAVSDGTYAFVTAFESMTVVELGHEGGPQIVATLPIQDDLTMLDRMELFEGRIYMLGGSTGSMLIIDVSDPLMPEIELRFGGGNYSAMERIGRLGQTLVVLVNDDYLLTYELSSMGPLTNVSRTALDGTTRRVAAHEGFVYASHQIPRALQIFDMSDPQAPVLASELSLPGGPWRVHFDGDLAYVPDRESNLNVVDVSDPFNPEILSTLPLPTSCYAVAQWESWAYVSARDAIYVVDVSDPAAPRLDATITESGSVDDLEIVGRTLYAAGKDFAAYSIADTGELTLLSRLPVEGSPEGLAMIDGYALLARWRGAFVVDARDPSAMVEVARLGLPNFENDVFLHGHVAYVATDRDGVYAVDMTDPEHPVVLGRAGSPAMPPPDAGVPFLSRMDGVTADDRGVYTVDWISLQVLPLHCANAVEALPVQIEVQSTLNCKSRGVIPVALYGSEDVDVSQIDHTTVRFGPGEAAEAHFNRHGVKRHEADLDGDGDLDLMFHFEALAAAIPCDAGTVTLTGMTYDGRRIEGTTEFQSTPSRLGPAAKLRLSAKPNPFNPRVSLEFVLDEPASHVRVDVFDLAGRRVFSRDLGSLPPGTHSTIWGGTDDAGGSLASGIYLARVEADGNAETRKVALVR